MINLDHRERVVVDANDLLAFKETGSFCSILRPHCEIVSDRQHGETQFELFGNELHVACQSGVSRIIEGLLLVPDDEPAGIAPIAAVGKLARMDGVDILHSAKIKGPPSAMIQRVRLFDALLAQPGDDFVIGDDSGVCAFGNFDRVGDVVEVTVRNENVVCRDLIGLDVTRELVWRDEWVEKEALASNFHGEARMTVIGKLHCKVGLSHSIGSNRLRQGERLACIEIFLVECRAFERLRYSQDFFDFGGNAFRGRFPDTVGYAGFRIQQIATGFWLVIYGFLTTLLGGDKAQIAHSLDEEPAGQETRPTAIVLPIFNEDVDRVFRGMEAMWILL